MVFDAWMYRDPMEVAMRRQDAAGKKQAARQRQDAGRKAERCAGCAHEVVMHMAAGPVGRCAVFQGVTR